MCDGWSERERVVYAVERQDHVIHLSVSAHIVPWVFELIRENLLAPVAVRLCGRREEIEGTRDGRALQTLWSPTML
jgi:hypothetical protein